MAGTIVNEYGKISIVDDLVATIAGYAAVENYGIVGMSSKNAMDGVVELVKRENFRRGVKVANVSGDELDVSLYVTLEYGVSLPAVAQNVIANVKYRVEEMTGLKVRNVNVHVEGIRA